MKRLLTAGVTATLPCGCGGMSKEEREFAGGVILSKDNIGYLYIHRRHENRP